MKRKTTVVIIVARPLPQSYAKSATLMRWRSVTTDRLMPNYHKQLLIPQRRERDDDSFEKSLSRLFRKQQLFKEGTCQSNKRGTKIITTTPTTMAHTRWLSFVGVLSIVHFFEAPENSNRLFVVFWSRDLRYIYKAQKYSVLNLQKKLYSFIFFALFQGQKLLTFLEP